MFKVGDIVQHKPTGKIGKIFGYGCRVCDRTYFITLKVILPKGHYFNKSSIEDKMNEWRFVRHNCPQLLNPPDLRRHNLVA